MKTLRGLKHMAGAKFSDADRKESELLARICLEDEGALKELYLLYYNRLHRFILRVNGGYCVDEIINDVMYVVWQKADTFNQSCLPSTWILGIAYNKARQSARGQRSGREESLEAMATESACFAAADAGLAQLEMSDLLEEAFKKLSPEQRAVVELTYFQGMSYQDIAGLMACSENTVKTRMYHARIKLSKAVLALEALSDKHPE